MSNHPAWWAFCMLPSNDGHANDTDTTDGAGITRWGFSYPTWVDATKWVGDGPTDLATFMKMDETGAGTLAQLYFWNRLGGEVMGSGPDVSVIDWAFNSGESGAFTQIQKHLGITADGIFGLQTLKAINAVPPATFIQDCHDWRIAFLTSLGLQATDPGCFTRTNNCLTLAKTLVKP